MPIAIGFPPAGGWIKLLAIIKNIPTATDNANVTNKGSGINVKKIPDKDVIRWPRIIFFGCEKGLDG